MNNDIKEGAVASIEREIELLTEKLEGGDDVSLLLSRAKLYMKLQRRDLALNDLNKILSLDSENTEAQSFKMLMTSIDNYFYNQTYNV